jgi:hypothetical protein
MGMTSRLDGERNRADARNDSVYRARNRWA